MLEGAAAWCKSVACLPWRLSVATLGAVNDCAAVVLTFAGHAPAVHRSSHQERARKMADIEKFYSAQAEVSHCPPKHNPTARAALPPLAHPPAQLAGASFSLTAGKLWPARISIGRSAFAHSLTCTQARRPLPETPADAALLVRRADQTACLPPQELRAELKAAKASKADYKAKYEAV